ncbi:hypothetical protein F5887DRAFT_1238226 [Amanita rubescens]|nr:hypothetical protein F5887DRAFT_1238226 [Amanita rubescens]
MSIPGPDAAQPTRPATPESLYSATPTIEDLTAALAEFSQRVPPPDPPLRLTCCCGKDECENLSNWLETKGGLETRLRLSAEVGQALLRRHEAYMHRHETLPKRQASITKSTDSISSFVIHGSQEERDSYVAELLKEKALLEKRLNQALINSEVSEASTKSILQELEEARATISRLTATQARSTGWDIRLSAAMKERNDIQQERDVESQRARLAETRFAALKEKAAKLQTEVYQLQEALESKRVTHLESSDCTLQDARAHIQLMQNGQLPRSAHDELAKVLESLVNDNEIIKRDNAELQQLLSDCREDFHALQEEVEEQRLNQELPPRALRHKQSTAPSFSIKEFSRSTSLERSSRAFEPLTPETNHRPLSPTTHLSTPSEPRLLYHPPCSSSSLYPALQISYDLDPDTIDEDDEPIGKSMHTKSTPTRSRGVQMNGTWSTSIPFSQFRYLTPYGASLHPPPLTSSDPRSESSSFSSETLTSHIAVLLERLTQLFSKLAQADALTLTNRLKRQHLYHNPGDVKHLSRSTINQILADAIALKSQFRVLLEDEKMVAVCTRKEVRTLFRLMREMFGEMGRLRVVLNDVILDPSQAPRVSEAGMDPKKREEDGLGAGSKDGWDGTLNWMGPLSKLFSPGNRTEKRQTEDRLSAGPPLSKSTSNQSAASGITSLGVTGAVGGPRSRPITVPKNAPALAASATTVNVEFLGAGLKGKTVTNTFSSSDGPVPPLFSVSPDNHNAEWQMQRTISGAGGSRNVMDIFAGAPSKVLDPEPWVVLPRTPRKARSAIIPTMDLTGRSSPTPRPTVESGVGHGQPAEDGMGRVIGGLSRYVDAVIDPVFGRASGPSDYLPTMSPLPLTTKEDQQRSVSNERPNQASEQPSRPRLRRGLSDSSIHSTFTSQAMDEERSYPHSPVAPNSGPSVGVVLNRQPRFPAMWPDRQSVLQALSRTMQNFRLGQGGASSAKARTTSSTGSADASSSEVSQEPQPQLPAEEAKVPVNGEFRATKTSGKAGDPHTTPRKGMRVKPRSSTPTDLGVSYYEYPAPGAMGTSALLNSLPARASMRDPFVWEA